MQSSEPEQAFPVAWSLSFPQISITISQGKIKSAKVNVRMFVFRKCLIDERKTILQNQFTLYIFLIQYVILESLIYSLFQTFI